MQWIEKVLLNSVNAGAGETAHAEGRLRCTSDDGRETIDSIDCKQANLFARAQNEGKLVRHIMAPRTLSRSFW